MNENKKNDLNGFEDNDQEIKTEEKKIKETRMIHSLVTFAVGLAVIVLAASSFIKKEQSLSLLLDISGFIYGSF